MSIQTIKSIATQQASPLEKARAAAKLKRDQKAAATIARQEGKIKAEEKREIAYQTYRDMVEQEQQQLEKKIAAARKAMGVRKNESNPIGIARLAEQWKSEMLLRIYQSRAM
jgi:hypothetical protein